MNIDSSFGPLGKSKILINATGSILITKDSQLLLPQYVKFVENPFVQFSVTQNTIQGSNRGDGLLTSTVISCHVLQVLEAESNVQRCGTDRKMILLLRALQAVKSSMLFLKEDVTRFLVRSAIWHKELSIRLFLSRICLNAVFPASNASVAQVVIKILVIYTVFVNTHFAITIIYATRQNGFCLALMSIAILKRLLN